jgi:membrane-bound lytic murein transglycosylase B
LLTIVSAPLLVGLLLSSHGALGRDDTRIEPVGALVGDDSLDPRILSLELVGPRWRAALAELDAALFEKQTTERGLDRSRSELVAVRSDVKLVRRDREGAATVAIDLEADIADARALLAASAISQFVRSGETESDILASADTATEGERRLQLSAEAHDVQISRWRDLIARAEQISDELSELGGRLLELQIRERALEAHIANADALLPGLDDRVADAMDAVRDGRRDATIPGSDLPVTALDAYLKAETQLAETEPDCGIEWWVIAGIGRVESRHGEIGGRHLADNGRTSPDIIGIPLDGGPNVRAVVDTDAGVLDGDTVWDRAVGPMQFIPETWSIRGRDGNDDGVADPHNIYDAAYSTGRYLCRLGGDLTTGTGRERAFFGYNTSDAYVSKVSQHAREYREALSDRLR